MASLPLRLLIAFVSDAEAFAWEGYLYSVLLFLTAILQSLCLQQYFNLCFQLGTNVRASLIAAIYKKVGMALSPSPAGFLLAGLEIPASLPISLGQTAHLIVTRSEEQFQCTLLVPSSAPIRFALTTVSLSRRSPCPVPLAKSLQWERL